MFSDSKMFESRPDRGRESIYHKRDITDGSSWVDRVINGVSLDDTLKWEFQNYIVDSKIDLSSDEKPETLMVNSRDVDKTILESAGYPSEMKGTGESKNFAGLGKSNKDALHRKWFVKEFGGLTERESDKHKTYFRKRKIPKSRHKNFPVKPFREVQNDKKEHGVNMFTSVAYDPKFEEECDVEKNVLTDEKQEQEFKNEMHQEYQDERLAQWLDQEQEEIQYYEDVKKFYTEEKPWCYAFVDGGSPDKLFLVHYNEKTDTYSYTCATDEYGTPTDYSSVMWCPPENWVKPVIYWDRIWTEMDFNRTGYRRAFAYYPEFDVGGVMRNAQIEFLKPRM